MIFSLLAACSKTGYSCPVTRPVWLLAPDDPAVNDPPAYGYYFVNKDRSIWASAWWAEQDENYLRATEDSIKMGWFRPEGTDLNITGQRLDAESLPLESHVPCCYPTRFQAQAYISPQKDVGKSQ